MKKISLFLILLCSSAIGVELPEDGSIIYESLQSNISNRTVRTESFSRKLEGIYKQVGIPIIIDYPRENSNYLYPLLFALHPEFNEQSLVQFNRAFDKNLKSRADLFDHYFKILNVQKIKFDKSTWLALDSIRYDKYRMFKGFLDESNPIGMTKDKIIESLGTPSRNLNHIFTYDLGSCLGLGVDSQWVEFILKDAIITDYRFRED